MEILAATLSTALVLYLLYKTDAVYSYLSSPLLSWLDHLTKMRKYNEVFKPLGLTYSEYMMTEHGNFLVKMLSCRYCLGLWLAAAASIFAVGHQDVGSLAVCIPTTYFGGQTLCSLFDWCERKMNDD